MLNQCDGAACPTPLPQPRRTRLAGVECFEASGALPAQDVSDPSEDVIIEQLHYACIHPADPRHLAKLVVIETYPRSGPPPGPRLMESARDEYRVFLESLRFTPLQAASGSVGKAAPHGGGAKAP